MSDVPSPSPEIQPPVERPEVRFVSNVLWSWVGGAVQLLPGLVVSPYLIFKLGSERYGIWSLAFSLVGYYALVDLGFRSAAVRYAAQFRAMGETENINELVNTLFLYFSAVAIGLIGVTLLVWQKADRFLHVPPQHHDEFAWLLLLAGINLSAGIVGGVFSGCVEGFHRFDVSNRIFIVAFGARSVGWFALLATGYGLIALGAWALVTNVALILMFGWAFYRMFPTLRLSPRRATVRMFRQTATYGIHTFFAGLATRAMEQMAPLLIGHYCSIADVGYYSFSLRLLQYGTDAVSRVGVVATPRSADMAARREWGQVGRLAMLANRYCLILFMPIAIFLGMFGYELLGVWLRKPDFATNSAPLLRPMLVSFTLAHAAQFCSASVLFGLGAQRGYAVTLVAELALNIVATILVLPSYGIMGAAVVTSLLMLIARGIVTPWLLCHHLHCSFWQYMFRILAKPLLVSVPLWAALIELRRAGITGRRVPELAVLGIGTTALYFAGSYLTCVAPEHKQLLRNWLKKKFSRVRATDA
jgi:O-antigen/teichoic acid export membrane protein